MLLSTALVLVIGILSNPVVGHNSAWNHNYFQAKQAILPGTSALVFPGYSERAIWDFSVLPILNTENGLDFIPYIRNSEGFVEQITSEGYGISISNPPVQSHCGCLPSSPQIKSLWQKRTSEDWHQISQVLNFDLVMVPMSVQLDLPIIFKNNDITFYHARKLI
jgi:hypothetical protein